MAEVYRAGIEAVPAGQMEAARSLGMSHGKAMRYVIVPQAVRKVIPPLLNDFIALMKDTSLVFAIGGSEVVDAGLRHPDRRLQRLGARRWRAVFFLVVTIPLARLVDVPDRAPAGEDARAAAVTTDRADVAEPPTPVDAGRRRIEEEVGTAT